MGSMPEAELELSSATPDSPSSISVSGGAPLVLAMARGFQKIKKYMKRWNFLCTTGLQYKPLNYLLLEISIARSGSTVHWSNTELEIEIIHDFPAKERQKYKDSLYTLLNTSEHSLHLNMASTIFTRDISMSYPLHNTTRNLFSLIAPVH